MIQMHSDSQNTLEALDHALKDLSGNEQLFSRTLILLSGDF